jgi:hypothetical protein
MKRNSMTNNTISGLNSTNLNNSAPAFVPATALNKESQNLDIFQDISSGELQE